MRITRSYSRGSRVKRASYNTFNGFEVKNDWYVLVKLAYQRCKGTCEVKGCYGKATEPHHIVPLSKGGTNTLSNIIYLCQKCHDKRHNHLFRARS